MTPYFQDPDVTIHLGDSLEVLRGLPDESVHCIATSPPFFGLRDYGVDGQIGLEASPDEWASRLVEVFREARRVLRRDGSLWVECGDSYNSGTAAKRKASTEVSHGGWENGGQMGDERINVAGLKPKDLIGQPFLLAFALRADGWYWRGVNIWAKPNAMPESAKDRCTVAHSYVLHFSKSARYFFDGDAISEPAAWERWGDQTVPKHNGTATATGWMEPKTKYELPVAATKAPRSIWTIPTQGYAEAHFATWPEALARRIILAACPEGGTILDPFGGSGTTALVARKHGRRAILIELNEDYCAMAARRLGDPDADQQHALASDGAAQLNLLATPVEP